MVLVRTVKIRITVKDRVSVKSLRVRVRLRVSVSRVRRSMRMENSTCHVYLSVPAGKYHQAFGFGFSGILFNITTNYFLRATLWL